MIRTLALIALLGSAACSGRAEDLERQYRTAEKTGVATPDELCERGRAVAEAHLEEGNDARYRDWDLGSKILCQNVQLERALG